MKKIKIFMIIALVLMMPAMPGCAERSAMGSEGTKGIPAPAGTLGTSAQAPDGVEGSQEKNEEHADALDGEFVPSMAGLVLGDSGDAALEEHGDNFTLQRIEYAYSMGETILRRHYPDGLIITVGEQSNMVLEIESTSPLTETNFGFQVGDGAVHAIDIFSKMFEQPVSRHGDGIIAGWFYVRGEEIVIVNYDETETLINDELKEDSVITRLKLSNFAYMD